MPGTETEWKMGAKTCSGRARVSAHSETTFSRRRHAASATRFSCCSGPGCGGKAVAAAAVAVVSAVAVEVEEEDTGAAAVPVEEADDEDNGCGATAATAEDATAATAAATAVAAADAEDADADSTHLFWATFVVSVSGVRGSERANEAGAFSGVCHPAGTRGGPEERREAPSTHAGLAAHANARADEEEAAA